MATSMHILRICPLLVAALLLAFLTWPFLGAGLLDELNGMTIQVFNHRSTPPWRVLSEPLRFGLSKANAAPSCSQPLKKARKTMGNCFKDGR